MKIRGFVFFFLLLFCNLSFAYENSVYIWQRSWKPEISESINRIAPLSDQFKVLAADLKAENKRIVFSKVGVNWTYLRAKNNVAVDIRMRTDLSKFLKAEDLSGIVGMLAAGVEDIVSDAKKEGINVTGVELDYDCPTSKLIDFTRFLKDLRLRIKGRMLSITALPTWTQSKDFQEITKLVDYYVLQLHSFEIPKNQTAAQYIFPKNKANEYFDQALSLNRPFYLSLPTYGYEAAYTKDDEFIGLRAEGGVQYFADGIKRKMIFAQPKEVVNFLNFLSNDKSNNFKGVCWFRLPVSSDRFNWDMKTLEKVIKREALVAHLRVEVIDKPDGLREIYLVNDGDINFTEEVSFDVFWKGEKPLYDILGDFEYSGIENGAGMRVTGQAPRVSQRKMAAWFRALDITKTSISNSEVRTNEKE